MFHAGELINEHYLHTYTCTLVALIDVPPTHDCSHVWYKQIEYKATSCHQAVTGRTAYITTPIGHCVRVPRGTGHCYMGCMHI